jgi:signal transduction histidine kinase
VILSEGTAGDARRGLRASSSFQQTLINSDDWISRQDEQTLEFGGPIVMPDRSRAGFLHVAFSLDEIEQIITSTTSASFVITLVCLGVGTLLALLLSGSFSRPLKTIAEMSKEIGEGKVGQRLSIKRNDEIGHLASAVNQMAGAIEMWKAEAELEGNRVRKLNQELEERVQRRTAELEAANRELLLLNQKQADFTAMIAHDLRSPLSNVVGICEMMKDNLFGRINEEQRKWIGKVSNTADGLVNLVSNFLDVSKLESGGIDLALKDVDVENLLAASLEDFHLMAVDRGVALRRNVSSDLPLVHADPRRLEQVLNNLFSNALKFTPKGGEIECGACRSNGEVKIWIRDTGVGIPLEEISQLFQKYKQTTSGKTSTHEGTGLGLAICKMIVEAHRGRIWAETAEGKGATFFFTLPIDTEHAVAEGPKS